MCAIPSVPNGNVIPLTSSCNATHCDLNYGILIRCDPKYILIGYGMLRCAGYGKWHRPVPSCKRKFECHTFIKYDKLTSQFWKILTCLSVFCASRALGQIRNGRVNFLTSPPISGYYNNGTIANFTCDSAYKLDGATLSYCLANGTWSTPPPICRQGNETNNS